VKDFRGDEAMLAAMSVEDLRRTRGDLASPGDPENVGRSGLGWTTAMGTALSDETD